MSDLQTSLQRIDDWIVQNDSKLAKKLQNQLNPGLSRSNIESKITESLSKYNRKAHNPHFPEEVFDLYQWHDGSFWLSNFASFNTLDQALGLQSPVAPVPEFFLPLFSTEYYFCGVFCDKKADGEIPIYHFESGQGNLPFIISPSLKNLMTAIAECLEQHGGFSPSAMAIDSQGCMSDQDFYYGPNAYCTQLISSNDSKLAPIYERYNVDWKWFLP